MKVTISDYRERLENSCQFRMSVKLDCIVYESILGQALQRVAARFDNPGNVKVRFRLSCRNRQLVLDNCGARIEEEEALSFLLTLAEEYLHLSKKIPFIYGGVVLNLEEDSTGSELRPLQGHRFFGSHGELDNVRINISLADLMSASMDGDRNAGDIISEVVASAKSDHPFRETPDFSSICLGDIPDTMIPYIKDIDFILGQIRPGKYAYALASYSDRMSLNISQRAGDYEFVKLLLEKLEEKGISSETDLLDSNFRSFDSLEVLVTVQA